MIWQKALMLKLNLSLRLLLRPLDLTYSQGGPWDRFPKPKGFLELVTTWRKGIEEFKEQSRTSILDELDTTS